MPQAYQGQIMTLDKALVLTDYKNEPIEWEKQEDGSYLATVEQKEQKVNEGKKTLPGKKFTYSIIPEPQNVQVSVKEEILDEQYKKTQEAVAEKQKAQKVTVTTTTKKAEKENNTGYKKKY